MSSTVISLVVLVGLGVGVYYLWNNTTVFDGIKAGLNQQPAAAAAQSPTGDTSGGDSGGGDGADTSGGDTPGGDSGGGGFGGGRHGGHGGGGFGGQDSGGDGSDGGSSDSGGGGGGHGGHGGHGGTVGPHKTKGGESGEYGHGKGDPGWYTAKGHHHCKRGTAGCICTDKHKCGGQSAHVNTNKHKTKHKSKAHLAYAMGYDGGMHYLESSPISLLYAGMTI